MIDLRSDTVTRPTSAMREAMARAEVGDDVYGEDPTVQRLETEVAALLGKERGLFVSSGTMGNQIAILGHCRPGDEVVVGEGSHSVWYESGAGAAFAGVQFAVAGRGGLFDVDELEAAIKPTAYWYPSTSLLAVEDTHNRAGGRVWPLERMHAVVRHAKARGLATHLDGARLWNAAVASGTSPAERAAPFDSVTVCLSKGLGAPVGSVLCGSAAFVARARRHRKMLGGGMRQVGVLAAAGLHALLHHRARLADDHAHARAFAEAVARAPGVTVDLASVETNIVNVDVERDAERVVSCARDLGLLVGASGPRRIRAVTHLDVDRTAALEGARLLVRAVELAA
ncbi:MAG: aminotransferase class I/II-fold pyridoxal phosphate-dependent enzyme [Deltaproteobacteria bacterium]|nr:aminotransferase class I/II-fold pyridoxal phosphate-dependent enzyme [Deltaproteobacteria bacterium]